MKKLFTFLLFGSLAAASFAQATPHAHAEPAGSTHAAPLAHTPATPTPAPAKKHAKRSKKLHKHPAS